MSTNDASPMVSVILPAYNCARYLEACVASVLGQSFADFELICVDDGSTDDTPAILARLAAADARIRVVRQDNAGYGAAMNRGLDAARGTYVASVESDDLMEPAMLTTLVEVAERSQADVVKADFCLFEDAPEGRRTSYMQLCPAKGFYGRVLDSTTTDVLFQAFIMTWAGLHRRSFLTEHGIRHNESPGAAFQDNGFWFQEFAWAGRVVFVNEALYLYRQDNPDSSTSQEGPEKFWAMVAEYDFIERFLRTHPAQWERLAEAYVHFRLDNLVARLFVVGPEARAPLARHIQEELARWVREPFFRWEYYGGELRRDLELIAKDPDAFVALGGRSLIEVSWAEVMGRPTASRIDPEVTMPAWHVEAYLRSLEDEA